MEVENDLDDCREEALAAEDKVLEPSFVEADSNGAVRGSLAAVVVDEVRNDLEAVLRLRLTADILAKFQDKKRCSGKGGKREDIGCRSNSLSLSG